MVQEKRKKEKKKKMPPDWHRKIISVWTKSYTFPFNVAHETYLAMMLQRVDCEYVLSVYLRLQGLIFEIKATGGTYVREDLL